jgi:Protein of unknown function (DUF1648)
VSGGPRRNWVAALICGLLPVALLAVVVAVPAALWSRLPERVADHWSLSGTANGTAPRLVPFLIFGVMAVIGTGIAWGGWAAARRRSASGAAAATALTAIGLFFSAIGAASAVLVSVSNLDGGGLRSASVGAVVPLWLAGGPLLLTALASYLLRRYGRLGTAVDGAPRASLGLRAGERAVWTGRARAKWAWPTGLLVVAAGVADGAIGGLLPIAVVLVLIGVVLLLGFTSIRVRVAARGVTIGYGVLGLRLTRIPLRRIASAEAVRHTAFSFGYRGSLLVFGGAAVALRRGPALRLTLRDGKTFLVTVDDPATGAALLNDLIAAG